MSEVFPMTGHKQRVTHNLPPSNEGSLKLTINDPFRRCEDLRDENGDILPGTGNCHHELARGVSPADLMDPRGAEGDGPHKPMYQGMGGVPAWPFQITST